MPYEPNQNNRSLFPNNKGDGFAQRVDVSAGTEMPPGLVSMTPLAKPGATIAARQQLGGNPDPNLTQGTSDNLMRRGSAVPWAKGRK